MRSLARLCFLLPKSVNVPTWGETQLMLQGDSRGNLNAMWKAQTEISPARHSLLCCCGWLVDFFSWFSFFVSFASNSWRAEGGKKPDLQAAALPGELIIGNLSAEMPSARSNS